MTLNWKKVRLYLLVIMVLASRTALERLTPPTPTGRVVILSFWLVLGLPLLMLSVIGLFKDRNGANSATVR